MDSGTGVLHYGCVPARSFGHGEHAVDITASFVVLEMHHVYIGLAVRHPGFVFEDGHEGHLFRFLQLCLPPGHEILGQGGCGLDAKRVEGEVDVVGILFAIDAYVCRERHESRHIGPAEGERGLACFVDA